MIGQRDWGVFFGDFAEAVRLHPASGGGPVPGRAILSATYAEANRGPAFAVGAAPMVASVAEGAFARASPRQGDEIEARGRRWRIAGPPQSDGAGMLRLMLEEDDA